MKQLIFKKPLDVFVKSDNFSIVTNKGCLENEDLSGLINFVDYGNEANNFLLNIGVKDNLTALTLLQILIDNQSAYLSAAQKDITLLEKRVVIYNHCLLYIAQSLSRLDTQLSSKSVMIETIRKRPWCLGYWSDPAQTGSEKKEIRITSPSDIYLIDDSLVLDNFPMVVADKDDSEALYRLYKKFGAKYLSECTQIKQKVSGASVSQLLPCSHFCQPETLIQ